MAPKTQAPLDFKQRKTRSSSLATPKKTKSLISEENVAPNSEVKLPRSTRNARLITDTKLRGVSPVKSPIKKKTLQPVLHTPLSSPLKSSPLKSIQLNRIAASPNKKVSTAKTKLFEENSLKLNTTPVKLATTPKKSQKTTESPSTSTKKLLHRTNVSRFGEAKKCLSLSHPEQVVGREEQIKILRKFLETNLTQAKQSKTPRKKCYKMPKKEYLCQWTSGYW